MPSRLVCPEYDYARLLAEIVMTGTKAPVAVNVRLSLCQTGLLTAGLPEQVMVAPCVTWLDSVLGVGSETMVTHAVEDAIRELVEDFCREYRLAGESPGQG